MQIPWQQLAPDTVTAILEEFAQSVPVVFRSNSLAEKSTTQAVSDRCGLETRARVGCVSGTIWQSGLLGCGGGKPSRHF